MKIVIFFVALFVFAYAQEDAEEVDEVQQTPRCNSGDTFFNGTLTTNEKPTNCSAAHSTCQTKLEVGPDSYRIYRQCQSAEACENNQKSNPQQCYSEEAEEKQEKVCHFCCRGDFCNDGSEIDVVLPVSDDFADEDVDEEA
uniref:uncharacterized protein LOC120342558 n=1 Tax=Styela clava TaxID=7725 RepID=UPI001939EE20|nr:uncharacterized protein LOC120342558 [Styela clava]